MKDYIDISSGEVMYMDNFVQMYDLFFGIIRKMRRIDFLVLFLVIERSHCGEIYIGNRERNEFGVLLEFSSSSIIGSLRRLVSLGLLLSSGRGLYRVNPKFFFRGHTSYRNFLVNNLEL